LQKLKIKNLKTDLTSITETEKRVSKVA